MARVRRKSAALAAASLRFMRRAYFKGIWGGVLVVIAAALAAFAVYGLATIPLAAHGGPYVVMGAVMYLGIAILLAVIGGRLIRSSVQARRLR